MRMALAAALILNVSLAQAQPVRDEATGLSIEPPSGYTATRVPPRGVNTVIFAVRKPVDRDTGCHVAFAPAPQNRGYTQSKLNEIARGEAWRDGARQIMSIAFEIDSAETFEHAGIQGLAMEGRPRVLDAMPEPVRQRAGQLRTLFVILETSAGRTTTVCVGEASDFAQRRAEFMQVARSTRPPA